MKNRSRFLNRTKYEDLNFKDLFVGNRITIFSRHLNLVDYADQYTSRMLGSCKERWESDVSELLRNFQFCKLIYFA